jgi:hypothetical protein
MSTDVWTVRVVVENAFRRLLTTIDCRWKRRENSKSNRVEPRKLALLNGNRFNVNRTTTVILVKMYLNRFSIGGLGLEPSPLCTGLVAKLCAQCVVGVRYAPVSLSRNVSHARLRPSRRRCVIDTRSLGSGLRVVRDQDGQWPRSPSVTQSRYNTVMTAPRPTGLYRTCTGL